MDESAQALASTGPGDPAVALRCRGMVKRYEDVIAVAGLDLEVRRGECFGLLGPNGAGKTTAIEILEGLNRADAGAVELFGHGWGTGCDQELRERIGIQLQETQLADRLTVEEVVRLFRSFYRRGRDVDEVIALVELDPKRRAAVQKLSGGQRQRLALACALISDPDILFLDEPTTGLDPQARQRVWQVVGGFLERGGTVMLTTHYMEEAAQLCSRVGIMDLGKLIALGSPNALIDRLGVAQIIEFEIDPGLTGDWIAALPGVRSARQHLQRQVLHVEQVQTALPGLLAALQQRSVEIHNLTVHRATLDDVFLHLTGKALRDG
ncbi:MAG: ABC transporter ATP-binding protein [Deltaproteobacteria bacterium]|nr:ABC transporter ATP-binding protein [Deltaproteobacteria bacterium]